MPQYIKVGKEQAVVRGESSSYEIRNYITVEQSAAVSLAVSSLDGEIPETANVASDRVYYFLDADAVLSFEDETELRVRAEDVVFIPKNTRYSVQGKFRAVLVNTPAFQLANESPS